ncbi:unnamed protein product [Discula destructiva]
MTERRMEDEEELAAPQTGLPPQEAVNQANQSMHDTSRLNMEPTSRLILAASTSLAVGGVLGLRQGSTMAGFKFRAEHAHKLPTTPTGWFMYHKSKNYTMARAGLIEGGKMGVKVAFVTTSMFLIEDLYDEYRQTKDFINTTLASLTVAGAFSLWNRFSLPMTARTTKTALVVGLVYGGLQDIAGAARGRPIGYIDWTRRKLGLKYSGSDSDGAQLAAP